MKHIFLLTGILFSGIYSMAQNSFQAGIPGMAETLDATTEKKIDSLISIMTLDEKIGQTVLFTSDWAVTGPTLREGYKEDIKKGKVGAIFNAHTADYNANLQKIAVEETRLGIPLIFGFDVIHGYKTIFPIPLGEAASWDLEAMETSARIAAVEASAAGLHWTFAPMVDVARDPRWGRIMEGAGEDTYLGTKIAVARVKGFQGEDLSATNTILACTKHYAAYGAAQAGRDYHTVDISEETLRDVYLPPFKATVDAGVATFMTSFNELNGVPATANSFLLDDILRKEWGFDGFVVTDYTSINEMIPHGFAKDEKVAGEMAMNAGVDMDMQGAVFYNHLSKSIKEGEVKEETLDEAVRRILRMKFKLGLFEDPYKYSNVERQNAALLSDEHQAKAREIARKSFVLLKNDNQVLPLSKDAKTIAVIGPLADNKSELIGAWSGSGDANDCISVLQGIKDACGDKNKVLYAKGSDIEATKETDLTEAIQVANQADVIVVVVGEFAWMSGEAASRSDISLPGKQEALIAAMKATGKPLIVVLMNGRPLTLSGVVENSDALIETWFAGTQTGNAVADVLFGDYNPAGKLPVTFPRSVGQIPLFYNMKNTGRPMDPNNKYTSKYLDQPNSPLFPFGFGLSYTTFEYSNLKLDKTSFTAKDQVKITVTVANTGLYDGEEVVQLYVHDLFGQLTRPVRELKGFEKIFLKKGERREISFTIEAKDLAYHHSDMSFNADPGDFDIYVGGSSNADLSTRISLK